MKAFFIILLSILVGVSLGISYFWYKKNLSDELIPDQNETAPAPKTFNYQIPVVNIQNQPSSTSSQIQRDQLKTIPAPTNSTAKKQSIIGQDYLAHYQNSINYLNQISNNLKNIQQTLVEIEKNYNDKNYLVLPRLVSKAGDENLSFTKIVLELKNSFDNWSTANRNTTNEIIKSKTDQVIEVGFGYIQSSLDFSKSTDKILAYKGIGDFNKLSGEFQEAAQKMETDGKKLNKLIGELNNILAP